MLQSARAHGSVVVNWPYALIVRIQQEALGERDGEGEGEVSTVSVDDIQQRLLTLIDLIKQKLQLLPQTPHQQSSV